MSKLVLIASFSLEDLFGAGRLDVRTVMVAERLLRRHRLSYVLNKVDPKQCGLRE